MLRGPLEDRKVTISRINIAITYPCNFIFIASMNPCPCGYYGANKRKCHCKPEQIKRYINKISGNFASDETITTTFSYLINS